MKTIKLMTLILLLTTPGVYSLSAQEDFSRGLGLAAKSSTHGFGGDAVFNFHRRMSLRMGYEQLAMSKDFDFEEESVQYEATMDYQTGGLSLLFDYYIARYFFVTAGVGYNKFSALTNGQAASDMEYGDIIIPRQQIGTFEFEVKPTAEIAPYAGIGFGRTLGFSKKVGFAFELGGFYQGPPEIAIASTGLLSPSSNPDQQHAERLEKQIEQYNVYPILKFSLSYKIAGF